MFVRMMATICDRCVGWEVVHRLPIKIQKGTRTYVLRTNGNVLMSPFKYFSRIHSKLFIHSYIRSAQADAHKRQIRFRTRRPHRNGITLDIISHIKSAQSWRILIDRDNSDAGGTHPKLAFDLSWPLDVHESNVLYVSNSLDDC